MTFLPPEVLIESCVGGLIFLFGVLEFFVGKQAWLYMKPGSSLSASSIYFSGQKTRAIFVIFLFIANAVRIVTLIWLFCKTDRNGTLLFPQKSDESDSMDEWLYAFLQGLPAVLYLSTYSIIVLFWAQVYYTARFMVLPFLRSSFAFLNLTVYLILIAFAFLTRLLNAGAEFRRYLSSMLGALYCMTAVSFCYFGFKIAFQFSGRGIDREHDVRKAAVVRRVLTMSIFCPITFLARGLYDLAIAFKLIGVYSPDGSKTPFLLWECLIVLLSEWLPATLVLVAFWRPSETKARNVVNNSSIPSIVAPLLSSPVSHNVTHDGAVNDSNQPFPRLDLLHEQATLRDFAPSSIYPLGAANAVALQPPTPSPDLPATIRVPTWRQ